MSNKILYKYYFTWNVIEKKRNPKSSLLYCILSIVKLQDVKNLYMYVNVYEKYYECFRIKSTEFLNEVYMINIYSSFTKFKWYIMIISGTKKKDLGYRVFYSNHYLN